MSIIAQLEREFKRLVANSNSRKTENMPKMQVILGADDPELAKSYRAAGLGSAQLDYLGHQYEIDLIPSPEPAAAAGCRLNLEFIPPIELPLQDPPRFFNYMNLLASNVRFRLQPEEDGPIQRVIIMGVETVIPLNCQPSYFEWSLMNVTMSYSAVGKAVTIGELHDEWSEWLPPTA